MKCLLKMEKLKTINELTSKIILRKLGMFASSYLGNDQYFLMEAINLLISDIGEEYLETEYKKVGKKWSETKEKLASLNKKITKTKLFYDPIIDKKFNNKLTNENKIQSMFKSQFNKYSSKLALIQQELFDIFVFLVNLTTIQRQLIPSEAYKIIEHTGFKTLDLSKNKSNTTSKNIT